MENYYFQVAAVPHWFLCETVASDWQHPYCFLLDDELQSCGCLTPGAVLFFLFFLSSPSHCVLTWSPLFRWSLWNSAQLLYSVSHHGTLRTPSNLSAGSWYVCLSSSMTHKLHFWVDFSGSDFLAHSLFWNISVIEMLSNSPTTSPLSSCHAPNWRTSKHRRPW